MAISKAESKNKSNRLKADLFEVLVAIGLSNKFNLKSESLINEADKLIKALSGFKDSEIRIKEQKGRVILALPFIVEELKNVNFAKDRKPEKVIWVGRGWQKKGSLSDVDLIFSKENSIGISLKSTRGGKGTQKNIGAGKLKLYLGLDVSKEVEEMWRNIRTELRKNEGNLSKLAKLGNSKIKDNKYRFPVIQEIGEKFGKKVQVLATKKSIKLFNNLNIDKKSDFLEFIFGSKEKRPLLNVLVEKNKVITKWNDGFNYLLLNKDIKAVKDKRGNGKGYCIHIGGKPVLRIQVNFTNGIGLSAFCERAFLV